MQGMTRRVGWVRRVWLAWLPALASTWVLAMGTAHAQASGLTQARLDALMSQFDRAVASRDAPAVLSHISDRAEILLTMEDEMGNRRRMRMSKRQYAEALQRSWSMASQYRYSRTPPSYEMQGSSAIIRSVVTESMTIQGQSMSMRTREETWVQLIDGQPKVVSVRGEVLR